MKLIFPKELDPLFDDMLNKVISDMYKVNVIPRSFIFEIGVRIVIRERIKEMVSNSSLSNVMNFTNTKDRMQEAIRDAVVMRYVISGYLICYYDLNKDK